GAALGLAIAAPLETRSPYPSCLVDDAVDIVGIDLSDEAIAPAFGQSFRNQRQVRGLQPEEPRLLRPAPDLLTRVMLDEVFRRPSKCDGAGLDGCGTGALLLRQIRSSRITTER